MCELHPKISTMPRPLLTTMADAGVDTSACKDHSVCGASTSAARKKGDTATEILKRADWTQTSILHHFLLPGHGWHNIASVERLVLPFWIPGRLRYSVCLLLFISIVYNVINSLSILSLMCDIIPYQCRYHADNYTNRSFHLMSWGMKPSLTSKFVKHESSRSHADRCSTDVFYSSFFETAECWVSSSLVLPVKKTMNYMSLRRPSGQDRLQMLPHMLVIVRRHCPNRWVNVGEFYGYYDVTLTSRRLLGCWQQCTSTVYPDTLFGKTLHWATGWKGVRFERQLISLQVN